MKMIKQKYLILAFFSVLLFVIFLIAGFRKRLFFLPALFFCCFTAGLIKNSYAVRTAAASSISAICFMPEHIPFIA